MREIPAVHILASRRNGTLYIGVTSNLIKRVWQHKQDVLDGFSKQYKIHILVYVTAHRTMPEAIRREKEIKKWDRASKLRLTEKQNPWWHDPSDNFSG